MILGVDYSFARPGGIPIFEKGYKFVCRYLSSDSGKALSKAELDELRAHGLEIVLVWEDSANAALGGKAQGVADATAAAHQATALGITGHPIYFAVDFDATPEQQGAINEYMQGVCDVIGLDRAGIYGGFYVVERVAQAHLAHWFWQTTAWSGGQIYSSVHIYQNGKSDFNGGADIDEARQTNFGQWPSPPSTTTKTTTTTTRSTTSSTTSTSTTSSTSSTTTLPPSSEQQTPINKPTGVANTSTLGQKPISQPINNTKSWGSRLLDAILRFFDIR